MSVVFISTTKSADAQARVLRMHNEISDIFFLNGGIHAYLGGMAIFAIDADAFF